MTTAEKPWPHPWPKGGRPPVIPNSKRWGLYVDAVVQGRAARRAERRGSDLPTVMRQLMDDYAAGRVTPTAETAPHANEETRQS